MTAKIFAPAIITISQSVPVLGVRRAQQKTPAASVAAGKWGVSVEKPEQLGRSAALELLVP
ncbi:hypothetical protein [Novosphingobium sp.]|uniref:hypothetical protein n=1 Tax=Novosphingobium sp. TaxID=1874826 RepID=UPI0025E225E8|nr:hypothetical protein [Novosphingobium sp.]